VTIPAGVPCFAGGMPEAVLAASGMIVVERDELDPGVSLVVWRR